MPALRIRAVVSSIASRYLLLLISTSFQIGNTYDGKTPPTFFMTLPVSVLFTVVLRSNSLAATPPEIKVYRDPGCGCCEKWAMGLQADGFIVSMTDDPELDNRRKKAGVPPELAGCHIAFLGDYVIEGHVPSEDIVRLIKEKPQALGLAVAGMPLGSPGMETGGARMPMR
jgi:hypothetical protein